MTLSLSNVPVGRCFVPIEDERRRKLERLILSAALAVCLLGFYLIYANKAYPYAEGWHIYYAELMKAGNVPYKDFFYYLPPLNLVIDSVLWALSFGSLLMFRIWRLIERLAMMQVVYFTLCRYYNAKLVFLGCLFGGIIAGGNVYDLLGDYNQTAEFLLILTALLALRFAEEEDTLRKCKKLAVAGVVIGLTFLCKQSTGGAAVLIYALFLCAWCFWNRDKRFFKYMLAAVIGILAPILLAALVLAVLGALPAAVEQIFFGAASKGGMSTMLIFNLLAFYRVLIKKYLWLLLGVALPSVLLYLWCRLESRILPKDMTPQRKKLFHYLVPTVICTVTAVLALLLNRQRISDFSDGLKGTLVVPVVLSVFLLLAVAYVAVRCLVPSERVQKYLNYAVVVLPVLLIALGIVLLLIKQQHDASVFVGKMPQLFKTTVMHLLVLGLSLVLAYGFLACLIRRKQIVPLHVLVFGIGTFCSLYSAFMASGSLTATEDLGDIPMRIMFFTIPFLFCAGIDSLKKWKGTAYLAFSACLIFCCFVILSAKAQCPYSWWGYHEAPIYQKTESVDIPGLEGYRFSAAEKNSYEQIYRLVKENTDADDIVMGFPYVKIFNILTDHIGEVGFVPVYFFDVCPDQYAIADAQKMEQTPPDIIIWQDMGEECWDVHEELFRTDGKMGQRDIRKWFAEHKDTIYEPIGQVGELYIYKLVDNGTPTQYRYFENGNGDAGNRTAWSKY